MSMTRRNDVALIGIVLLACGIAALSMGSGIAERLLLSVGLWLGAGAAFARARC